MLVQSKLVGKVVDIPDSPDGAVRAVRATLLEGEQWSKMTVGLVGGSTSRIASPMAANVSNPLLLPFVGLDTWLSTLSNSAAYPFFVRHGLTTPGLARAVAQTCRFMGWGSVAVISSRGAYEEDMGTFVASELQELGGKNLLRGTFNEHAGDYARTMQEMAPLIQRVKAANMTIIFLETSETGARAFLEVMFRGGVSPSGYAFVSVYTFLNAFKDPLADGSLSVFPVLPENFCTPADASGKGAYCPKHVWSGRIYDAVQAIAHAAAPVFGATPGATSSFFAGDIATRNRVMASLRRTNLFPPTVIRGPLRFTPGSNDRMHVPSFAIKSFQRKADGTRVVRQVGRITSGQVLMDGPHALTWPGGRATVPSDDTSTSTPGPTRIPQTIHLELVTSKANEDIVVAEQALRDLNEDPSILPFTKVVMGHTHMGKTNGVYDPATTGK